MLYINLNAMLVSLLRSWRNVNP